MGAPSQDGGPGLMAGITAFEAGWTIAEGIDKGDWKIALSGIAATGLDIAAAAIDPIAYVAGQLFSWMLEHLEPARAALHALTGNPDMVKSYAQSWTNVENEMLDVGKEYGTAVTSETTGWTGVAGEAYRNRGAELAGICGGVAGAVHGIATLTLGMAEVVNGVRTAVRDVLAAIAGPLVSWTIEIIASWGTATPLVIGQATAAIARVVSKVAQIMSRLSTVVGAAISLLIALRDVLDGLIRAMNALEAGGR